MLRLQNSFLRMRVGKFASSRYGGLAVAAFFALVGFITLNTISAATFSVGSEAEDGELTGNYSATADADASNSNAIAFGVGNGPTQPSDLKAYTGGDSIALRWTPSATPAGSTIKQYNIFRDNIQVATVLPGFHADFVEKSGASWVDYDVAKGTTYSYRVQTVSSTNATSALSTPLSVQHPTTSAPVPTLSYELNGATDLEDYMKNMVVPFLKVWYPKVANLIAYPDYTPLTNIRLVLDPNNAHTLDTSVDDGHITANTTFIRDNMTSYDKTLASWLHEATHSIQVSSSASNAMSWLLEAGADYSREYIIHDRDPRLPTVNEHYSGGYGPGAYLINYIHTKYDSNFLRKATVAGHNNVYTANMNIMPDGKNLDEVWTDMLGEPSRTGAFKSVAYGNKCIDIENRGFADRTKVQLYTCNNGAAQKLTAWSIGDGAKIMALGKCLEVSDSGTANGTAVWLYNCNIDFAGLAQKWVLNNDGTIVNPNSGKCLEIANGSTSGNDAAQLQIWDCNGGAWQKWTVPANSPKFEPINFKSAGSQCLDDPAGTTDGAQLQVAACNSQASQKWTITGPKDSRTALTVMAKCAAASGMASGSPVQLYGCSGSTSQTWKAQNDGSFKNQKSGLCLDTTDSSTTNDALLIVNICNGNPSQSFNF